MASSEIMTTALENAALELQACTDDMGRGFFNIKVGMCGAARSEPSSAICSKPACTNGRVQIPSRVAWHRGRAGGKDLGTGSTVRVSRGEGAHKQMHFVPPVSRNARILLHLLPGLVSHPRAAQHRIGVGFFD